MIMLFTVPLYTFFDPCKTMHNYISFLLGILSVVKKLDQLMPILVNCFRESTSLIRTTPAFDSQSFDCMLKTIQCIHLAAKVLVNESHLPSSSSLPALFIGPNGRSTLFTQLSKLWESFPIGKMHSSTEKVISFIGSVNMHAV